MCTKFWLRLEGGRCNDILLNAYYTCKEEKHEWIENIKYLLFTNGYGNIWYNCALHSSKDEYINNTSLMFHTRMKDEYCQYYDNKCKESNIITSLLTQMYTVLKNILIMLKILLSEVTYVN